MTATTEKLGRYHAEWFDHVDLAHKEIEVIATSEHQVRSYVDSIRLPEHRTKVHQGNRPEEDSLVIDWIEEVTLPYEIN